MIKSEHLNNVRKEIVYDIRLVVISGQQASLSYVCHRLIELINIITTIKLCSPYLVYNIMYMHVLIRNKMAS